MSWILDSDRPIYMQIVEIVQRQIVSGTYKPGDKLPSVREMAAKAGVNPNTMQKAYALLEQSGLIETQRTSGRSVTEDEKRIQEIRDKLAVQETEGFVDRMKELGYSTEGMIRLIKEVKVEGEV